MEKPSKPPQPSTSRQEAMAEKRAAALRANLKKRKEQSTARTANFNEQELQSKT